MKIVGVEITNPDKILFPESKITKLDIAQYYEKVADKILPELKNRQISLVRSPEGIGEVKFYQKHPSESFPDYIERVKIKEKEGTGIYIEIDSLNDIIYLVNIGVLEFHAGNSLLSDYEHPDRIIFDLDPSEDASFDFVFQGALILKYLLDKLGLKNSVKTSGGKGFHVIAELKKKMNWEETKDYTKAIADSVVEHFPDKFTTALPKHKRKGKVFIDYLRNTRGGTTVAAYSTRARENAPVSMPIDWQDIEKVKPDQFTIKDF